MLWSVFGVQARSLRSFLIVLTSMLLLLTSNRAVAAPDEIQVYIDDLNRVGGTGLDVHVNYVATGDPQIDYTLQQSSIQRLRVTPEFSYGLSDHVELGLYLPLATYDRSGRLGAHGLKGRIKFIGSKPGDHWFWGANLEVGYEDRALATNAGNAELKLIGGVHAGKWLIATNGDYPLFCAEAGCRQITNRSPKITANWLFASPHSRGGRFHSSAA